MRSNITGSTQRERPDTGQVRKSLPKREERKSERGASKNLVLRDGFRPLDGAFIIAPICA